MKLSAAFRSCLETLDACGVRALWAKAAPHLPQPADDTEALAMLHRARTESEAMPLKLRLYSHFWLLDHDMPSALPDDLKPRAERVHPRIAEAVGISCKTNDPDKLPLVQAMQREMSNAVMECYADGDTDPGLIKARIRCARRKVLSQF